MKDDIVIVYKPPLWTIYIDVKYVKDKGIYMFDRKKNLKEAFSTYVENEKMQPYVRFTISFAHVDIDIDVSYEHGRFNVEVEEGHCIFHTHKSSQNKYVSYKFLSENVKTVVNFILAQLNVSHSKLFSEKPSLNIILRTSEDYKRLMSRNMKTVSTENQVRREVKRFLRFITDIKISEFKC